MHACTIVARNYLAQAQVLVNSFREHHPNGTFDVLLVDEPGSDRPTVEGANVLMIDELGISPGTLERMSTAYTIIEIATGIKPWGLRTLLDRGYSHAVYIDPDILIARPIDELPALAEQSSIVLTPHLTEPMPRDGGLPAEQNILLSGTYNLGFIAVGNTAEARRMLDWWSARLASDCFVDVANGFFVDQRFMDFVPGLFDCHIERDPSWNVAYWNLATRKLTRAENGSVLVNGRPLTFVHLSGYSPKTPHLLTKHQGPEPRLLLSQDEILRELCDDYGDRLEAAGFERAQVDFTPPFNEKDGFRLDRFVRKLIREELVAESGGKGSGLAWCDTDGQKLVDWLTDPTVLKGTFPNIGRYLSQIWRMRGDLQIAYPNVPKGDVAGFLEWNETFGLAEESVPPFAIERAKEHLRSRTAYLSGDSTTAETETLPGLEVVGYLSADLGLGETARQFVASAAASGVPVSTRTYTRTLSRLGTQWEDLVAPQGARYDTVLVCVNADMLPTFAEDAGPEFFQDRYIIGLWFWELAKFPADMAARALECVDEVWVCSEFNAESIRIHTEKPVIVVPHPAHAPAVSRTRIPEIAGEQFTFLFVFDFLSVMERKNPIGLIDAFTTAFPNPGEARLVIKSINGDKRIPDLEKLRYAAKDRDDIILVERYLDRAELDGLMWNADCYVSLHRSEGFGQTLAETMAIGKPVIATRYSGNLMFMDAENSLLVGQTWTPVPPGNEPYTTDSGWAEPKHKQAVKRMRRVYEDADLSERIGTRAARSIAERHSTRALAAVISARLGELAATRGATVQSRVRSLMRVLPRR